MPTPGERLVDTSVAVDYLRRIAAVKERLEALSTMYVSTIALGELYLGAKRSAKPVAGLAQVERFAALCVILACDTEIARRYSTVKLALQRQGTPIPENDIWIATSAIQHG